VAFVAEDLSAEGVEAQARDLADRGPGVPASAIERSDPDPQIVTNIGVA
jgi:hypothetical protein